MCRGEVYVFYFKPTTGGRINRDRAVLHYLESAVVQPFQDSCANPMRLDLRWKRKNGLLAQAVLKKLMFRLTV